jgi:cohesin complex subunit SA-1/2
VLHLNRLHSVFVHRYRDLDPNIRAECVRALGFWFKKFPSHFLDTSFLRYVGWVLSDNSTQVRLEAVKALAGVYDQAGHIDSLNLFTERFKPRLIEMAHRDIELGVRVAVVQVLSRIDQHSMLEAEEREKLCLLLFDEESKVRKAISGFVGSVWEDLVDERLSERTADEKVKERTGMKVLGMLLVKWGNILEKTIGDEEEESEDQREDNLRRQKRQIELGALMTQGRKGRTALAVEALWDEIETVSNWEGLLDMLLLDHSAAEEGRTKRPVHANGRNKTVDNGLDEAWRLDEAEESVLLEVLVASLQRAKPDAVSKKVIKVFNPT